MSNELGLVSADQMDAQNSKIDTLNGKEEARNTVLSTMLGKLDIVGERLTEIRNVLSEDISKQIVYGFHIDASESDPEKAVVYLKDAAGLSPAHMDFTNDTFVYGSWEDAFFMPRPCMIRYDGTVDYYLNPNDYTKKMDGTTSDIADDTYAGNAMMEWGKNGQKIWYKIVPDTTPTSASVYISNVQVDPDYHAWSFINNLGRMVDHFYTPIYNGTLDSNGKLRSISGKAYTALCQGKNATQEIAAARLNNPTGGDLWNTEVYADVVLINLLLILMGKSLNTTAVFGNGRCGQASAAENMLGTGTMNDKGLFWGSNANTSGVKVFGMENWWGNQWRRYAGHVLIEGVHKYKLTKGRQDGSTADDYVQSTTGSDYDSYIAGVNDPGANGYVSQMTFDGNNFMQSSVANGDSTKFWADYYWRNTGCRYACHGGDCAYSAGAVGAFFVYLAGTASNADWSFGAAPSCKPLS